MGGQSEDMFLDLMLLLLVLLNKNMTNDKINNHSAEPTDCIKMDGIPKSEAKISQSPPGG